MSQVKILLKALLFWGLRRGAKLYEFWLPSDSYSIYFYSQFLQFLIRFQRSWKAEDIEAVEDFFLPQYLRSHHAFTF